MLAWRRLDRMVNDIRERDDVEVVGVQPLKVSAHVIRKAAMPKLPDPHQAVRDALYLHDPDVAPEGERAALDASAVRRTGVAGLPEP